MNKLLSILTVTGCIALSRNVSAQLTNTTGQPTGAPVAEVMHDRVDGHIVLITGETLKGKITYNEFGERTIFLAQSDENAVGKKDVVRTFEKYDSIVSMYISGRGYYDAVDLFGTGTKKMAFVSETHPSYKEYKFFQSGAGLLGHNISGGEIKGTYDIFIFITSKNLMIKSTDVKDLKNNIDTYMSCPSINEKVKKEEKGYKQNLMNPAYILLKKVLIESEQNCK